MARHQLRPDGAPALAPPADDAATAAPDPGDSPDPVLDVDRLGKSYGGLRALDELSLAIRPGEVHGLLGPNGSGKSTALHVITGLLRPDSGGAYLAGLPLTARASRNLLGFAPDDLPLPDALTGAEFLDLHDALRRRDDTAYRAELVDRFELGPALDTAIADYSHGMKRKVHAIAALMHRPRLLVLDEPFRGLDPRAGRALRDELLRFADRGGAVLVATHDLLRAQRDCSTVTIVQGGRVVAQGSPAELIARAGVADLEEVFLSYT